MNRAAKSGTGLAIASVIAMALLSGCTGGHPGSSSTSTVSPTPTGTHETVSSAPSSSVVVSTAPAGSSSVTVPPTGNVNVDDSSNGQTITVPVGRRVIVTLGSTYWKFSAPSSRSLTQLGAPSYFASPGCVSGAGCGTATLTVTTTAPGTASVDASRTTCGEALKCAPDQMVFHLQIVVSA